MKNSMKIFPILILTAILIGCPGGTGKSSSGGNTILTGAQLRAELEKIQGGGTYTLKGDVALSENWEPIGTESQPFKGIFDGGGKTIRGLVIDKPTTDNVGLFGFIEGGEVKNLTIKSPKIKGNYGVGALVGEIKGGTITKIKVTGGGEGKGRGSTGGLIGRVNQDSTDTTIKDCETNIPVSASDLYGNVGGLIGSVYGKTTIENCTTRGDVTGGTAGGIVGLGDSSHWSPIGQGSIKKSHSEGTITGVRAGGLIGNIDTSSVKTRNNLVAQLLNCSASGDLVIKGSSGNMLETLTLSGGKVLVKENGQGVRTLLDPDGKEVTELPLDNDNRIVNETGNLILKDSKNNTLTTTDMDDAAYILVSSY